MNTKATHTLLGPVLFVLGLLLLASTTSGLAAGHPGSRSHRGFNHMQTGFALEGAHRRIRCESCHSNGIFRGTPKRCVDCHDSPGRAATQVPRSHIATSGNCEACHNATRWTPVEKVDHADVMGNCSTCHNGRIAAGKPHGHPQTHAECNQCHNTHNFTRVHFDHSGVTGNCASCHNGRMARGKPANHIPT
ncbi:MAG: cytochrome C, partial [Gammaproteobacteria bacterium]